MEALFGEEFSPDKGVT